VGFPGGSVVKNLPAMQEGHRFNPWVGKIPWRRKWQPIPVFLPGKSHGQRSLVGYSSLGCKRVRYHLAAKNNNTHTHTHTHMYIHAHARVWERKRHRKTKWESFWKYISGSMYTSLISIETHAILDNLLSF